MKCEYPTLTDRRSKRSGEMCQPVAFVWDNKRQSPEMSFINFPCPKTTVFVLGSALLPVCDVMQCLEP